MRNSGRFFLTFILCLSVSPVVFASSYEQQINELRSLVLQQQAQLSKQSKEIAELKRTVHSSQPVRRVVVSKQPQHIQAVKEQPTFKGYQPKKESNKTKIKISGQIDEAALYSNDGREHDLFFTTNDSSNSRVRVVATKKANEDLTIGGEVEMGLNVNSSAAVSQANPSPSSSIDLRKVELFFASKRFGKLWLGKGKTASDETAEVDLSGTGVAAYSGVASFGGALYFRTPGSDLYLSNPQVGDVMDDIDGFGRKNRLRYDTPSFYGFSLGASEMEGDDRDVALKFDRKFGKTHVAGALAYTSQNELNDVHGNILDGSLSVLLGNGLNGTIAAGNLKARNHHRKNPNFYYMKLGYQAGIWQAGKTNFSVDYGKYQNYAQDNDVGKTYGAAVVQDITRWNLGLYIGYRRFMLNRTDARFKDIDTVIAGAIFKF